MNDEGDRPHLRVGDLVGRHVRDERGRDHGPVLDVRTVQDGPVGSGGDAALRVDGLLVGGGRLTERLGLFRHEVHGPWILKAISRHVGPTRRFVAWSQLVDPVADLAEPDSPLRFHGATSEPPD